MRTEESWKSLGVDDAGGNATAGEQEKQGKDPPQRRPAEQPNTKRPESSNNTRQQPVRRGMARVRLGLLT